jgi:hypothetical protein
LLCSEFRMPSEKRGSVVLVNAAPMIVCTYMRHGNDPGMKHQRSASS